MGIGTILLFGVIGLVVVGTALGMLLTRNTVYAAIFLVLNFASVALLYLILGAPFIAITQVTVYAGAIMVLFLFVIMLLGSEKMAARETIKGQRFVAILLGIIFLAEAGLFVAYRGTNFATLPPVVEQFGSPSAIGLALFTTYMLPFEITSIILLVALVGAIILTRQEKPILPPKES